MEIGIFVSHAIWRFRTRAIRKQAKAEGKTFDDVLAEHRAAGTPFAFAEREIDPRLSPSALLRRMLGRAPKKGEDEEECAECAECAECGSGGEAKQEASPAVDESPVVDEKGLGSGEPSGEPSGRVVQA